MANRVYEWVDERTGIKPVLDFVMYRRMPKSVNWFFTLGSASLTIFLIQAVSGAFLAMGYTPSTAPVALTDGTSNEALQSLRVLTETTWGFWMRGFHHWGANVMVVVVLLHMLRVYFMGSYKYPRELTWFTGVFILLLVLGFSFTGYLLPWDNRAYWATQVGVRIGGSAPVLGDAVSNVLRGGPILGAATLSRFYAIHVLILPSLTAILIGVHMFLIIKIGISGMPKSAAKERNGGEFFESASASGKKTGHAFFPYIIFKDAVISLVIVGLIVLLTVVVPLESSNPVDPNNPISTLQNNKGEAVIKDGAVVQIQPQPEWYFLFLYQFLKYFPAEFDFGAFKLAGDAVGGVILPTVGILLLLLLPYLDRGPKRNPLNRPITSLVMIALIAGIVTLTVIAINDLGKAGSAPTASAATSSASSSATTTTAAASGATATTAAAGASTTTAAAGATGTGNVAAGLKAFTASGCVACHPSNGKVAGVGPKLLGTTRDDAYIRNNIRNGLNAMPAFTTDQVSDQQITDLIAYIRSLK
jgi:ubiquinol-cytochrome c reductase cytochrome b subunit